MTTISATVRVDLRPLQRFRAQVDRDLRGSGNGPIRQALKQWAVRYMTFIQRRYRANSRGAGEWPDLAESTKRRRRGPRRGRGGARKFSILIDTGTLFAATDPIFQRKPGQLQDDIPFGVRVGFGGPAGHPGGRATIADIASFHQTGAGRLPRREILVPPTETVMRQMGSDMSRAVSRMIGETGNGGGL
jgi:hypothetical protein